MTSGSYIDQNYGLFELAHEVIRHSRPRYRRNRASTRLRVPLARANNCLSINPTGSINRGTTAQLTGNSYDKRLMEFELSGFQDRGGREIPTVGPPVFADGVDPIPIEQTFEGFRLELSLDVLCVLRGVIAAEPVPITGLEADHTRRVANAWVTGMCIHTGIS